MDNRTIFPLCPSSILYLNIYYYLFEHINNTNTDRIEDKSKMEGKCSFLTNSQYTNSDIPSLSMIELQGDLESMVEGKLNGLQLGALKYNQLENNYTLQIENHAIIGI